MAKEKLDHKREYKVIPNLELVEWVEPDHSLRKLAKESGKPMQLKNQNFEGIFEAIRSQGDIFIATPFADLTIFAPIGRYEGCLVAVRQSGVNVRRFLIKSDTFSNMFSDYENMIDHLLSNNSIECEIELQHLRDFSDAVEDGQVEVDDDPCAGRLKIDIIAAKQIIELYEEFYDASDADTHAIFATGFSVGRLFSSIQNLASLEDKALSAAKYRAKYQERGKKGKSDLRKGQRLLHLLNHMERLQRENPAFGRLRPIALGEIALQDASKEDPKLWSQGRGQLEAYLTILASDTQYKSRFESLFFKTA